MNSKSRYICWSSDKNVFLKLPLDSLEIRVHAHPEYNSAEEHIVTS